MTAFTNGSFEDGSGGIATGWIVTVSGTSVEYADFTETPHTLGFEEYDGWSSYALITEFTGLWVDLDPAIFEPFNDYEGFEIGWGAYTLYTYLSSELAIFGVSDEYDSFESGWGDFWTTLLYSELAIFDSALTPENYEDFEDGFGLGTQTLITELTSVDTAMFDSGTNPYESFDDAGWPTLTL